MKIIAYSSIDRTIITYPGLKEVDISDDIAIVLRNRGCAGSWSGDRYIPCDSHEGPYCSQCSSPDPCVICKGECMKSIKTCCDEHSVYLAAFAPGLIKVGVTRTPRFETRLKEQGADMGFELLRLPDGELARRRERGISAMYPDKVSFNEKLNSISRRVSERAIQEIYNKFNPDRAISFRYFKRDISSKPILIQPGEDVAIAGRVLGIKGQVLVIEKRNSFYAVNLDSLIGYEIEEGRGSLNLQTSLSEYDEEKSHS